MNFDYCPNVSKLPLPLTCELFGQLIRQPWLQTLADEIAAGNLNRKRDLPAACWQASYGGQKRSNQNAIPSGLFALDVDHVEDPLALYDSFKERISELGIYVVHKTPSTKGLRIVALCRPELRTIGENQSWLSAQIQVEHDAATHDMARLSFLVPESYFYYFNPSIFTDEPVTLLSNSSVETPVLRQPDNLQPSTSDSNPSAINHEPSTINHEPSAINHEPSTINHELTFRGIPYSDIVSELIARTGGEPFEGERNNRLYLLCRLLANITDRQSERLMAICPRFGLSEAEVRACCESACKSARTEKLPYVLYKVLRDFGIDPNKSEESKDESLESIDEEISLNPHPSPLIPTHLPPLIREFVDTAPEDFKEATALACLPVCGFLGSRLRARYVDEEEQAPSFIVNIIAPAASGKGSFLRIPDMCLERVRIKDEEGRAAEAEYNRQIKLKKNEKKQIEEPQPIVRDIPVKVSVAQLLKRMKQAQGLHLISISPEADTMTNSNKSGSWAMKSDIYRIAQDGDGGRYGQDYKSDISFSATCKMRYNLLTLGTPGAMARAYPDVEDGLISRCIMVTLPSQFGKPMPVRKAMTQRQIHTVQEKVDALMAICQDEQGNVLPEYHLSLPWLREGMAEWFEQQRLRAVRDNDHARDQFRRRAALIGFRAGMVAAFLWGRTTKERKGYTLEFALWVAEYILQSLIERYREKVNEQSIGYDVPASKRYPSLFDAMPDIFTLQDLRRAVTAQGCKSPIKSIIFRWSENALIEKQGDTFVKLVK